MGRHRWCHCGRKGNLLCFGLLLELELYLEVMGAEGLRGAGAGGEDRLGWLPASAASQAGPGVFW